MSEAAAWIRLINVESVVQGARAGVATRSRRMMSPCAVTTAAASFVPPISIARIPEVVAIPPTVSSV